MGTQLPGSAQDPATPGRRTQPGTAGNPKPFTAGERRRRDTWGERSTKGLEEVPKVVWEEQGCQDRKPKVFCSTTSLLLLEILSLLVGGGSLGSSTLHLVHCDCYQSNCVNNTGSLVCISTCHKINSTSLIYFLVLQDCDH